MVALSTVMTAAIPPQTLTGEPWMVAQLGRNNLRIIVGRGDNRHVFERPTDRLGRERMAEDLKNFLFRPAMLNR